jgi:polar amino acid transport system substrate-binding protein
MKISAKLIFFAIFCLQIFLFTNCSSQKSETVVEAENNESSVEESSSKESGTIKNDTNTIIASLAQLPGLTDSPNEGAFVDIVKAIDEVYEEGNIDINVYPLNRSVDNVLKKEADFHMPTVRNNKVDQSELPFSTVTKKVGDVVFVVYSNIDNKITTQMIDNAVKGNDQFPYKIEAPAGLESQFEFPYSGSNDLTQSIKKLEFKRIDALVWAQEETDTTIKDLKAKTIYREKYDIFDDTLIIQKGEKGEKIDKIISECLTKLEEQGKLKELYSKVHLPYDDWQPSQMGW